MQSPAIHSAALAIALALLPPSIPAATNPDNFIIRTAGDLAALCSASQENPMVAAALGAGAGLAGGRIYDHVKKSEQAGAVKAPKVE